MNSTRKNDSSTMKEAPLGVLPTLFGCLWLVFGAFLIFHATSFLLVFHELTFLSSLFVALTASFIPVFYALAGTVILLRRSVKAAAVMIMFSSIVCLAVLLPEHLGEIPKSADWLQPGIRVGLTFFLLISFVFSFLIFHRGDTE